MMVGLVSTWKISGFMVIILFLLRLLFLVWVYPDFRPLIPAGVLFFTFKFRYGSFVHGAWKLASMAKPVDLQVWTLKYALGMSSPRVLPNTNRALYWVRLIRASCVSRLGCRYWFAVISFLAMCIFRVVFIGLLYVLVYVARARPSFVQRFQPTLGVLVPAISGL